MYTKMKAEKKNSQKEEKDAEAKVIWYNASKEHVAHVETTKAAQNKTEDER